MRGCVARVSQDSEGRGKVVSFEAEGDVVLDPASIFFGQASMQQLRALEQTTMLRFKASMLRKVLAFGEEGTRQLIDAVIIDAFSKVLRHLDILLRNDGTGRYEALRKMWSGFASRLAGQDVASYIRVSPVSLSRIRARRRRA